MRPAMSWLPVLLAGCVRAPPAPPPTPLSPCDALVAEIGPDALTTPSLRLTPRLPPTPDIPADQVERVAYSEEAGALLFMEERASRKAREQLAPALATDARLSLAWATDADASGVRVYFVGELGEGWGSLYQALYDPAEDRIVEVTPPPGERPDQPTPLPPDVEARYRALLTASLADFELHPEGVVPVVLPLSTARGESWMVYFLSSEAAEDTVQVGGHVAVWVDAEGRQVLEVLEHSAGSDRRPWPTDAWLTLYHDLTPWPLETHVYTSLRTGLPLCVETTAGSWAVVGQEVRFLGSRAPVE